MNAMCFVLCCVDAVCRFVDVCVCVQRFQPKNGVTGKRSLVQRWRTKKKRARDRLSMVGQHEEDKMKRQKSTQLHTHTHTHTHICELTKRTVCV